MEFHDLGTRRPKTTRASLSVLNCTNFLNFGCLTSFQNELCDAIPFFYLKVFVSMIEENDFDFTSIIRIDDTGTDLNTMLHGETRSRGDPPIHTTRKRYCNTGTHESAMRRRYNNCVATIQIITDSTTRSTSRDARFIRKLFDFECRMHVSTFFTHLSFIKFFE